MISLTAVDGIPDDVTPTHDPASYRKGVEEPGPDVGAWSSIALSKGLARIAYQDREGGALKYAFERSRNEWSSYPVDAGTGEEVGRYASMVIDGEGRPAIAYIALGNDDGAGHRVTELRIARANTQEPNKTNDWTTALIASGTGTCAGLCNGGEACIVPNTPPAAGETCTATTTDCTATCADDEACIAGSCTTAIASTTTDIGSGTGLYVNLVLLPDGRLAAVYYDRNAHGLKLAIENGVGATVFTESDLDGGTIGDRGLWASAVVDGSGTIHIAYQDAIGDQLMYITWNGTPSAPEIVDDGQRAGDRTHSVGAAAAIYLVNGSPVIAYQDGLTADVYVATKAGATWTTTGLATGLLLDGFSIAATTGHGTAYLAWDRLDPALSPPNGLAVETP